MVSIAVSKTDMTELIFVDPDGLYRILVILNGMQIKSFFFYFHTSIVLGVFIA